MTPTAAVDKDAAGVGERQYHIGIAHSTVVNPVFPVYIFEGDNRLRQRDALWDRDLEAGGHTGADTEEEVGLLHESGHH